MVQNLTKKDQVLHARDVGEGVHVGGFLKISLFSWTEANL